jgi:hypothetical protein
MRPSGSGRHGGSVDVGEIAVAGIGMHRLGKRRAIAAGERLVQFARGQPTAA